MTTETKNDETSFFDDLMSGFQELREWAKGEKELRTTAVTIPQRIVRVQKKHLSPLTTTIENANPRRKIVRVSSTRKARLLRHAAKKSL